MHKEILTSKFNLAKTYFCQFELSLSDVWQKPANPGWPRSNSAQRSSVAPPSESSARSQYNAKNYLGLPVLANNGCKMSTKEG